MLPHQTGNYPAGAALISVPPLNHRWRWKRRRWDSCTGSERTGNSLDTFEHRWVQCEFVRMGLQAHADYGSAARRGRKRTRAARRRGGALTWHSGTGFGEIPQEAGAPRHRWSPRWPMRGSYSTSSRTSATKPMRMRALSNWGTWIDGLDLTMFRRWRTADGQLHPLG